MNKKIHREKYEPIREKIKSGKRFSKVMMAIMSMVLIITSISIPSFAAENPVYEQLKITNFTGNTVKAEGDPNAMLDSYAGFYDSSFYNDGGAFPKDSLTINGVKYSLPNDYKGNDSIHLYAGVDATKTKVTMESKSAYARIYVLAAAGGIGAGNNVAFNIILNYTDGERVATTLTLQDWYDNDIPYKYAGVKRYGDSGAEGDTDGAPYLQQVSVAVNKNKLLQSIDFEYNAGNDSGLCCAIYAVTGELATGVPAKITDLEVVNRSSNAFTLNWSKVDGAEGYYIDVAKDSDSPFTQMVDGYNNKKLSSSDYTESGDKIVYQVGSGIEENTPYQVRVRPYNTNGQGASSSVVEVTTTVNDGSGSGSTHSHSMTKTEAVAATCTQGGNIEYYYCGDCGNYYTDEAGNNSTTLEETKTTASGHDWSEWEVITEATATAEGKQRRVCNVEVCGVKQVEIIPMTGGSDGSSEGAIDKSAEVEKNETVEEAILTNSKTQLTDSNIFSDNEKQQIERGVNAKVWLEINETDIANMDPDKKAKVEEKAIAVVGENAQLYYFEADLFKQVGPANKSEVREPGIDIKIAIKIADVLVNQNPALERQYSLIRTHESSSGLEVDIIPGTYNKVTGELLFETDRFSTYAIVYEDVPANTNNPGGSNPGASGTPDSSSSTSGSSTTTTTTETANQQFVKDSVPKTGENADYTAMVWTAILAIGVIGLLVEKQKRRQ